MIYIYIESYRHDIHINRCISHYSSCSCLVMFAQKSSVSYLDIAINGGHSQTIVKAAISAVVVKVTTMTAIPCIGFVEKPSGVLKHGWKMDNLSGIFPMKPPFIRNLPASHVWLPKGMFAACLQIAAFRGFSCALTKWTPCSFPWAQAYSRAAAAAVGNSIDSQYKRKLPPFLPMDPYVFF